jgi:carbon monoxide dehydrogenase subunit G
MLEIILYVVIALLAIVLLVTLCGFALPRDHRVARTVRLARAPDDVWRIVRDVERTPAWRTGVKRVETLGDAPLRWKEHSRQGALTFVLDETTAPAGAAAGRLITRIADDRLPFGGRWIHEVRADGDGTRVTVTEDGFVSNPLFRFLSRFVFGHTATLEQYLRDLGRALGVTASPEPAEPAAP